MEDIDHDLARQLSGTGPILFHEFQAKFQRFFVLGLTGQRLGQLELRVEVLRIGGGRFLELSDVAVAVGLQFERGFDLCGLWLEEPAFLQFLDQCAGLVGPALAEQNSGQSDRGCHVAG